MGAYIDYSPFKLKEEVDVCKKYEILIESTFKRLRTHFKLPRDVYFFFRRLHGKCGQAYVAHIPGTRRKIYKIEIDPRKPDETIIDTILHELTHIEQFYTGRLRDSKRNKHFKWCDEDMKIPTLSSVEYNNTPWEKEAIEKSSMVCFMLSWTK
jgi:hypothetical protein